MNKNITFTNNPSNDIKEVYKEVKSIYDELVTVDATLATFNRVDLTLAALEALITASSIRKITYYVTDKGWLLIGTSSNTLVPVSGSLQLALGDTLPTGIIPETVYINSGAQTGDLTTGLSISALSNYVFNRLFISSSATYTGTHVIRLADADDNTLVLSGSFYSGVPSVYEIVSDTDKSKTFKITTASYTFTADDVVGRDITVILELKRIPSF